MTSRRLLALCVAMMLGPAFLGYSGSALAQSPAPSAPVQSVDTSRFLNLAHSSSVMQARASELVATHDVRPEARSLAQGVLEFRRGLNARLAGLARERNVTLPTVLEFEHQTILENLQPLDGLELSRRYAEVEIQALEQELQIYRAAPTGDAPIQGLANETVPKLQELLDQAQRARQTLGP
jgi:putative membrane protein